MTITKEDLRDVLLEVLSNVLSFSTRPTLRLTPTNGLYEIAKSINDLAAAIRELAEATRKPSGSNER